MLHHSPRCCQSWSRAEEGFGKGLWSYNRQLSSWFGVLGPTNWKNGGSVKCWRQVGHSFSPKKVMTMSILSPPTHVFEKLLEMTKACGIDHKLVILFHLRKSWLCHFLVPPPMCLKNCWKWQKLVVLTSVGWVSQFYDTHWIRFSQSNLQKGLVLLLKKF